MEFLGTYIPIGTVPQDSPDSVITNTRSQHVLEKVGFSLFDEDDGFKYYKIERGRNSDKVILQKDMH